MAEQNEILTDTGNGGEMWDQDKFDDTCISIAQVEEGLDDYKIAREGVIMLLNNNSPANTVDCGVVEIGKGFGNISILQEGVTMSLSDTSLVVSTSDGEYMENQKFDDKCTSIAREGVKEGLDDFSIAREGVTMLLNNVSSENATECGVIENREGFGDISSLQECETLSLNDTSLENTGGCGEMENQEFDGACTSIARESVVEGFDDFSIAREGVTMLLKNTSPAETADVGETKDQWCDDSSVVREGVPVLLNNKCPANINDCDETEKQKGVDDKCTLTARQGVGKGFDDSSSSIMKGFDDTMGAREGVTILLDNKFKSSNPFSEVQVSLNPSPHSDVC